MTQHDLTITINNRPNTIHAAIGRNTRDATIGAANPRIASVSGNHLARVCVGGWGGSNASIVEVFHAKLHGARK
jgi:hypothetical protein